MSQPTTGSTIFYSLVVIVLAFFASQIAVNTVGFPDDLQTRATDLVTNLGVLLILVERSLEIFTDIWRRSGRATHAQNLASAEEYLADKKAEDVKKSTAATQQSIINAMNSRDTMKKTLEDYRAETGKLTIRASLVIGIFISAIGFRVLETIFITDALTGLQLQLFNIIDILLSAGVLAGGSAGIHTLSSTLGQFFENSKNRSKN